MPLDAAYQTSFRTVDRQAPDTTSTTQHDLRDFDEDRVDLGEVKSAEKFIALTSAIATARGSLNDLLRFRRTWGATSSKDAPSESILRASHYPDSHILHFSVLAALILAEGMANAYFFSTGSDLGLLGGWLQAITVSFTNVIAAFFLIGFLGLRHLSNPHRPINRILAIVGIAATSIALLALNLSAAHFRDLLELNAATLAMGGSDVTGDMLTPVTAARLNPFGFETLEALLLFVLGVTFACIAAYKGRTFDDAIPGYGGVSRQLAKDGDALERTLVACWRKNEKDSSPTEAAVQTEALVLLQKVRENLKSVPETHNEGPITVDNGSQGTVSL
jgi:arginine exporter protein ArgO